MQLAASGRHFTCKHCGSSQFPGAVDADGVRVLGSGPGAAACPLCTIEMAHALLHDEPIQICLRCRGMMLPLQAFADLVHEQRTWAQNPPRVPPALDPRALDRRLTCPVCQSAFMTYTYGGPGNAVIDGCTQCHLLWLDAGEFRQIVDAPGRDRGVL
jgi:Zn-finger nucleic acid-binding protein